MYHKGDKDWHSTVLWAGLDSILEIDYEGYVKGNIDYVNKYRKTPGYDLFEEWKKQKFVKESVFPQYRDVFDLLEKMLTIDWKERPMA